MKHKLSSFLKAYPVPYRKQHEGDWQPPEMILNAYESWFKTETGLDGGRHRYFSTSECVEKVREALNLHITPLKNVEAQLNGTKAKIFVNVALFLESQKVGKAYFLGGKLSKTEGKKRPTLKNVCENIRSKRNLEQEDFLVLIEEVGSQVENVFDQTSERNGSELKLILNSISNRWFSSNEFDMNVGLCYIELNDGFVYIFEDFLEDIELKAEIPGIEPSIENTARFRFTREQHHHSLNDYKPK